MVKRDKYHPDYAKLYPGEEITLEVLESLKRSDRKMEYMEVDLKQGTFLQDAALFTPGREISLEHLMDIEDMDFASVELSPEEIAVHNDEVDRLCKALKKLKPEEYALIHALFFEQISQEVLAKQMGITQQGVSWKLRQVLARIKKLMEI